MCDPGAAREPHLAGAPRGTPAAEHLGKERRGIYRGFLTGLPKSSERGRIPALPVPLPARSRLETLHPQAGDRPWELLPQRLPDRTKAWPSVPRAGTLSAISTGRLFSRTVA